MIVRKEVLFRHREHGATWGLWARLDASLYTAGDASINSNDRPVLDAVAWLRPPDALGPSVADGFADAIARGRTAGWSTPTTEVWLVVVHQYSTTPSDSDENTPALSMFEWLRQVLGPSAIEPVVSFDKRSRRYVMAWKHAGHRSDGP